MSAHVHTQRLGAQRKLTLVDRITHPPVSAHTSSPSSLMMTSTIRFCLEGPEVARMYASTCEGRGRWERRQQHYVAETPGPL